MSNPSDVPGDHGTPSDWEQMLRSVFGAQADDVLREMRERGLDPAALAAGAGVPGDPAAMSQILAQVQRVLSTSGGTPVNQDVAHDIARRAASAEGDPVPGDAQVRSATQALSVAELWLDAATDLPPAGGPRAAWSRSQWVERTLPSWNRLAEPVAASVADALASVLKDQLPEGLEAPGGADAAFPGLPDGMGAALFGPDGFDPSRVVRQLGSAVFGMQVGQGAGTLSREVFGATDIGVPLLTDATTVLLPANVAAFAEGLDAPLEEVQLFLALREAAHARLFTHVGWLRAHLLGLVGAYARGISIDVEALEDSLASIDLTDTSALQDALSGGVFGMRSTPEQKATLLSLETTLALVEGWVDEVSAIAAAPHLPHAGSLREMIRRRRAAGGPAEATFASLVGLELRPRRSRDAATLWGLIAAEGGPSAREEVWAHPDLLPTTEDLDDPAGYRARREALRADQADMDRALAEILGEVATGEGGGAPVASGGAPEGGGGAPAGSADSADDAGDAISPEGARDDERGPDGS